MIACLKNSELFFRSTVSGADLGWGGGAQGARAPPTFFPEEKLRTFKKYKNVNKIFQIELKLKHDMTCLMTIAETK